MKNIKTIIWVLVILTVVFLAFKLNNKKEADKNINSVQEVSINDSTDFYNIKGEYPNDSRDKEGVIKSNIQYLVDQKKEEWKIGGEAFNAEKKVESEYPDRPKMTYELNVSYASSASEKIKTVSYIIYKYIFTGGANGEKLLNTFSFNSDGQIKIEDIINFNDGNDISLSKDLAKKLELSLGESADLQMINDGLGLSYLKEDGTFDKVKCNCDGFFFPSNFQNFVILDNGVKFIMNPYSVAAGVVGAPEVVFTWEELSPYLNLDFKTKHNL